MQIFPSLTSQDPLVLEQQIKQLHPYCTGFHIDIMDGIFVANTMGSAALTNKIANMTQKQLWVHIMAQNPLHIIKHLQIHAGDIVTFHVTAEYDYQEIIQELEKRNLRPSLALNPAIPLPTIVHKLYAIDHITVMSVQPGASGRTFIEDTYTKLELIHAFKAAHEKKLTIAVDGGVNKYIIPKLAEYGVNQVAVCSAIFDTTDLVNALQELTTLTTG